MAIDRWLLQCHHEGRCPSTLRFYTWQPAALSLGYFQQRYPEHWQHLHWQGKPVDIIRRPSGGRAVLHQGDLTYAVVTSGLKGSRRQNYEQICQFLIRGWQKLGVELAYGEGGRGYRHNPNCFGTATTADLIDGGGYKRIGSAQKYRGQAILQHGSIALFPDRHLYRSVFNTDCPPPIFPAAVLEDAVATAIATLEAAARDCFRIELRSQPLTAFEKSAIAALISPD
jgi:lipoate-protein ligase A